MGNKLVSRSHPPTSRMSNVFLLSSAKNFHLQLSHRSLYLYVLRCVLKSEPQHWYLVRLVNAYVGFERRQKPHRHRSRIRILERLHNRSEMGHESA